MFYFSNFSTLFFIIIYVGANKYQLSQYVPPGLPLWMGPTNHKKDRMSQRSKPWINVARYFVQNNFIYCFNSLKIKGEWNSRLIFSLDVQTEKKERKCLLQLLQAGTMYSPGENESTFWTLVTFTRTTNIDILSQFFMNFHWDKNLSRAKLV